MSATHSAAIVQKHLVLQNRSRHLHIPQFHILILAWSRLVILYGGGRPIPLSPRQRKTDGLCPVASV